MRLYKHDDKCNICGTVVRKLRERESLTQERLAAKLQCEGLNLTQMAVSRIETGERVVADFELVIIARTFNVHITELLLLSDK